MICIEWPLLPLLLIWMHKWPTQSLNLNLNKVFFLFHFFISLFSSHSEGHVRVHAHTHAHRSVFGGTLGWLEESAGLARRERERERSERSTSYLRQLIRETHIAGQLFKAYSWITYRRKPLEVFPPYSLHPPGREGHESTETDTGAAVERVCACVCMCTRVCVLQQARSKSLH